MVEREEINTFCRYTKVSRETLICLKKFEEKLIISNKKLNLIGKSTLRNIWDRHFLDSAQVIDFIDKNFSILIDLGSGAGFPGLIISILAKQRELPLKIKLIEKSPKKAKFLKNIIEEFNLDAEVINKNIYEVSELMPGDVFVARAFKPLPKIFELMHRNNEKWKKIIVFLGKTGKEELIQASKVWDIEYKERVSITSKDSIILEISKLKKV